MCVFSHISEWSLGAPSLPGSCLSFDVGMLVHCCFELHSVWHGRQQERQAHRYIQCVYSSTGKWYRGARASSKHHPSTAERLPAAMHMET